MTPDINAPHELAEAKVLTTDEFITLTAESMASGISPKHPTYKDVQSLIDMGRMLGKITTGAVISAVYKWGEAYAIFILAADEQLCDCENCTAERKANKPTIH